MNVQHKHPSYNDADYKSTLQSLCQTCLLELNQNKSDVRHVFPTNKIAHNI